MGGAGLLKALAAALGIEQADLASVQAYLELQTSPVWLMLDDFPRFIDEPLDSALNTLLRCSSHQVHWWIASRRRPVCQLMRLLLEGELLELGAADLALTTAELEDVLKHDGHQLPLPTVERLLDQFDGWYAGVRLQLHAERRGLGLESASGNPLIEHYLESEVLDGLPQQWRHSLCTLACLPSFDAALCEHLLGAGEGAWLLKQLHEAGVFIEALDKCGSRFRVQPVVAALLAANVAQAHKTTMFQRACQWCITAQHTHQAIEYALLAQQPEVAATLLHEFTQDRLLQRRDLASVLQWRNKLPPELVDSSPQLLTLNAWALLLSGRLNEAQDSADLLQRFMPQPDGRRQREWMAQWQVLTGNIACHRGDPLVHDGDLDQALEHLAEGAWAQRLLTQVTLVELALIDGRLEQARQLNRSAVATARRHGSLAIEAVLLLQHVQLLEIRGELERADNLLERLHLEMSRAWSAEASPLRGRVQLRRAAVMAQSGRSAEAMRYFQIGLQECLESEDATAFQGYLGLAELAAGQNDLARAFSHLADGERLMQCRQITEPLYESQLVLAYGNLWFRQGRHARVEQTLELCLAQYRGADARKPPIGNPELLPRMELLLVQVRLAAGQDVFAQLDGMRQRAQGEGRRVLVCELWLCLAEAHYAAGQQSQAKHALKEGLALSRQFGLTRVERTFNARNTVLMLLGNESMVDPNAVMLSRRELTVLEMIAQGLSNQEIAQGLHLSLHTVKSHAQKINAKLGVSRRTQAIAQAKHLGLVA